MMTGTARYNVGDTQVICITDGGTVFPTKVFPSLSDTDQQALLRHAGLTKIQTAFNCYVLRMNDGRITLVDTGCGAEFGDAGGAMRAHLAAVGIVHTDVSRVIFTHLHSDHCGGALDGDALVFPNAEIVLHHKEAAFWQGKDAPGGRLLARAPNITTVEDDADIGDGIQIWALPGHTPGHIGLRIGNLALVGDIVHSEALQLPDPRTATIYDSDKDRATQSRMHALAMLVDKNLVWSGSHMLGPDKFARLRSHGHGFERISQ
jgi:glyoxylase-like metal-dependent hydrolase (beta-lactamase superfamily II)